MTTLKYGSFECYPTRYNDYEAWVYFDDKWNPFPPPEVMVGVATMTKERYYQTFPRMDPNNAPPAR